MQNIKEAVWIIKKAVLDSLDRNIFLLYYFIYLLQYDTYVNN